MSKKDKEKPKAARGDTEMGTGLQQSNVTLPTVGCAALMAMFLVVKMCGDCAMFFPLMAVSFTSYVVTQCLCKDPISYTFPHSDI